MSLEDTQTFLNNLKMLPTPELEVLVTKLKQDFAVDLETITALYKDRVAKAIDREQAVYKSQVDQKSMMHKWILEQIKEINTAVQVVANLREMTSACNRIFETHFVAQKSFLISMIDQMQKNIRIGISDKDVENEEEEPIYIPQMQKANNLPKITCSVCKSHLNDVQGYRKHLRIKHSLNYKGCRCPFCDFTTRNFEEYQKHVFLIHNKMQCECEKTFSTSKTFTEHIRICLKFYEEPLQGKEAQE